MRPGVGIPILRWAHCRRLPVWVKSNQESAVKGLEWDRVAGVVPAALHRWRCERPTPRRWLISPRDGKGKKKKRKITNE